MNKFIKEEFNEATRKVLETNKKIEILDQENSKITKFGNFTKYRNIIRKNTNG